MFRGKISLYFITLILSIFMSFPALSEGFITGKLKLPFEPKLELKNSKLSTNSKTELLLTFKIDNGAYLYKDMLSFKPDNISGIKFGAPVYPKPEKKMDKFSNHEKEIYPKTFIVKIPVEITDKVKTGKLAFSSTVGFQGCSKTVCFIPQEKTISTTVEIVKKK